MDVRVKVIKTGDIRVITHKAYAAMGPKIYERLDAPDVTELTEQKPTLQVHRSVSRPVVKPQILADETDNDQPEIKEEQPKQEMTIQEQPKVKGKPGPKPKSISSNSTVDEK